MAMFSLASLPLNTWSSVTLFFPVGVGLIRLLEKKCLSAGALEYPKKKLGTHNSAGPSAYIESPKFSNQSLIPRSNGSNTKTQATTSVAIAIATVVPRCPIEP